MSARTRALSFLRSERLIRTADRLVLRRRPTASSGPDVLIAPPGRGNIGDQALVEAFAESVAGPVVVVVRDRRDFLVPDHLRGRVSVLPLPALIYGTAVGRARDLQRLRPVLATASSVSIIGADVMDGAYVLRASVNRAALAERLVQLGWPVRIIGFSWNASPHPAALRALARASSARVRLLVRDPRSAERARSDGLAVTETADIVFLARSRDPEGAAEWMPRERPYALLNASGLVSEGGSALAEYGRIVDDLVARGLDVLVVPHVSRPGADDLPLCSAIAEQGHADHGDRVRLIPTLLAPATIRSLAAGARVVVTGRMHLAVMSLMSGVPAITVATQGKVEGLMDLFEAPELCVQPGEGLDARVIAALDAVLTGAEDIRVRLGDRVHAVTELARQNVEGLDEVESATAAAR